MSIHFGDIMVKITKLNPKCCFLKVPNDKQLPSKNHIKMWKRTKLIKLFIETPNFVEELN